MINFYVVNNNATFNPGLHHEVHSEEHANFLGIRSFIRLGKFYDEKSAVASAKKFYSDADGCASAVRKLIGGEKYGSASWR